MPYQNKKFIKIRLFIIHWYDFFYQKVQSTLNNPAHLQSISLWVAAISVGLCSVIYAKLFNASEHLFLKILNSSEYAAFLISPILFLLSWFVVKRFAPEAAGSGIPQIMAANETEYSNKNLGYLDKLLGLKTSFIKIISSLLCVIGGGAIGREGPTLQISASIFHFFGTKTKRFLPDVDEHTWVVAGAASGLASAFNTPLGGIVYAIEELGLVHFSKIRTALISGVIVSGLMAQWLLGSYLYLGFPDIKEINYSFFPVVIFTGLFCGYLGAIFGFVLLKLLNVRLAIKSNWKLAILTILCGISMASLAYYNKNSSGTGINLTAQFLFNKNHADLEIIFIRFFGTIISYISGAAGGIFSPSLTIGATIGSYLSVLINSTNSNLMVLLGMIGFLTGVTRTPFTSFILVLEMTDRHSSVFPMMLVALSAQWAASMIDPKSFYEHVKEKFLTHFPTQDKPITNK